jgi:hypothetical protein
MTIARIELLHDSIVVHHSEIECERGIDRESALDGHAEEG